METKEIQKILTLHQKWLSDEEGGKRANLAGAYLAGANLEGAYLKGAYLEYANLTGAHLEYANLAGAHLQGANLREDNLREAILVGAILKGANLKGANLQGAHLTGANLKGAHLAGANLKGAHLTRAILQGANLAGANLAGADLPAFLIVPSEGSFIAWKKCKEGAIVKLLIPKTAKRHSCITSRKCRASKAKVLQIMYPDGVLAETAIGTYDSNFIYRTGELVIPDSYDPDVRCECSNGIHFFLTKEEAGQYCC